MNIKEMEKYAARLEAICDKEKTKEYNVPFPYFQMEPFTRLAGECINKRLFGNQPPSPLERVFFDVPTENLSQTIFDFILTMSERIIETESLDGCGVGYEDIFYRKSEEYPPLSNKTKLMQEALENEIFVNEGNDTIIEFLKGFQGEDLTEVTEKIGDGYEFELSENLTRQTIIVAICETFNLTIKNELEFHSAIINFRDIGEKQKVLEYVLGETLDCRNDLADTFLELLGLQ